MSPRARRASRRAQRKAQRVKDKAAGKRVGFFWRWRRVFFLFGLLLVLGIAGVGYLFTQVPLPAKDPPLLQTTFFCAADVTSGCNADNSLAQLSGGEDRVTVTYDQIPGARRCVWREDRTYFKHGGVDPVGVARACGPTCAAAARSRAARRSPSSTSRTSTSPTSGPSPARSRRRCWR